MKVVLSMLFLTFSNADVWFAKKKLTWRTYTIEEALPIICWIELINQKEFAKVLLDENIEAFMVHFSCLRSRMTIYLAKKAQLALLLVKKVTIPAKYSDFADVFLEESANVLPEQTEVNEYTIKLEKGKQPSYGPIYSLEPVEFKTLKTYIEINLANGFIKILKSQASAPILFVRKSNGNLCLFVNYRGLNNLTIKNRYLLPLIRKSPDCSGQAKQFTKLDLTSVYYWLRIKEGDKWKTAF